MVRDTLQHGVCRGLMLWKVLEYENVRPMTQRINYIVYLVFPDITLMPTITTSASCKSS